jgi:hypothetical protein
MTERLLVVGKPIEHALPYDRHHDLDRIGLPDVGAQYLVRMFDGADDEDVPAHNGNVPLGCAEGYAALHQASFGKIPVVLGGSFSSHPVGVRGVRTG